MHDISFGTDGRVAVAVTSAGLVALYDGIAGLNGRPVSAVRAPNTEGALLHSNGRLYAMASGIGVLAMFEGDTFLSAVEGYLGAHDVAEGVDGSVWVADNRARRARGRLGRQDDRAGQGGHCVRPGGDVEDAPALCARSMR